MISEQSVLKMEYRVEDRVWIHRGWPSVKLCGAGVRAALGVSRAKGCNAFDLLVSSGKVRGGVEMDIFGRLYGNIYKVRVSDTGREYQPQLAIDADNWLRSKGISPCRFWVAVRNRKYERKTRCRNAKKD